MDSERWDRVRRLFDEALEQPQERREEFVRSACPGDPEVEEEVLALLREDQSGDSLLDRGVDRVADALLDGPANVPESIGPYRLTRPLGEGGMGVVYLAERDDIHRLAAIKFVRDAKLSPQRAARFLQEQRILARLAHPSISRLYDAGTLPDGTPYFVMEYVDGLPLTEFCARNGLSLERRLRLFRKVCEAVLYAHRQALIHRDLKPSNILAVGAGSEEPSVKLLDFGIAKEVDPPEDLRSPTQSGLGIMTPAYAAPEQLRGEAVGVATDVYSLGVVLYELLTGDLPFDLAELSPFEAAKTVTAEDPDRPSDRGFQVPVARRAGGDLDVLCMTALHKDPDRRYSTVEALIRDIDHYLAGEPLEARPESVGYRLGKFLRRNRRAVAAAATTVAIILALIAFYTARLSGARDAAIAEAERTQRIQRFMLDLFEGGDNVVGPEAGLLVTTLIERGVREARVLDVEPAIQGELFHTLGEVYHRMAEFDRAEELLQSALDLRRSLLGNAHPDVSQSLTALGLLSVDQGELERAEQLVREAMQIVRVELSGDHPQYAETLSALGSIVQQRGRYGEAVELLDEAIEIQEETGDQDGLRASLTRLAAVRFHSGDYEGSESINRRLLELTESQFGRSHPSYASSMINLATSRRWIGYIDEAERLYREALEINEVYHGRNHPTVASNLSLLGAVLTDQERYDEARTVLDEALAVREAVYGSDHLEVALTLNQLARCQLAGQDLDAAEASFARELAIYRATVGDEHPWTATGLSNLATIHFRRGQEELAEQMMRRSLATFQAALKPDHVDVAIARIKLGRLLAQRERYNDALAELTAGHETLTTQASPSLIWIRIAREELAAIHERLGNAERAAELRAKLE